MSNNPNDEYYQQRLGQDGDRWEGGNPLGIPAEMEFDDPTDAYGRDPSDLGDELERYGLTPEIVGKTPDEVDSQWLTNLHRYQFFCEYLYEAGRDPEGYTEVAPIQFRTTVYTVGQPSQTLMDFMGDHINGRQKTLFDTGKYNDYFTNWMPFKGGGDQQPSYRENIEGPEEIGPDEVKAALGVPFFEVEIYDEDMELRGEARGYADPFRIEEVETPDAPQQVEWAVRYNANRRGGTYELAPQGAEARRLAGGRKTVSLDGQYIGTLQKSRARGVYLAADYKTADKTFKDQNSGLKMWSRQKFVDEGVFHPNALRKGGKVWKVKETDDHIALESTKPDDWQGVDPDAVDVSATGTRFFEVVLSADQSTRFEVRADNKISALGYYNPVVERHIAEETEFEVLDPSSGSIIMK